MSEPSQPHVVFPDSTLGAALGSFYAALVTIARAEERMMWKVKVKEDRTAGDRTKSWHFADHPEILQKKPEEVCEEPGDGVRMTEQDKAVTEFAAKVEQAQVALDQFLSIWRLDPVEHEDSDHYSEFKDGSSTEGCNVPTSSRATTPSDEGAF
ncbi:hypothetical protein QFC20_003815 [Naganishia adeliensis]|uniref:Uncharacterized protein n=1 Tax=Naganishia adeliensis TaxID=92952 RepID=A0ACC2W708_9TREE|nr:hypothetical protein QFC20_003815 [Naganishia adeliensis]